MQLQRYKFPRVYRISNSKHIITQVNHDDGLIEGLL